MKKIADGYTLYVGDCLDVLKRLPDCSVEAICTDPPAGIAFMGKSWDTDKGGRDTWIAWLQAVAAECHRVIKPGGHALVWALPRTSHWTGMAWENAGWEPRDKIVHIFGSGFPKSLNVGKAIDKAKGAERLVIGKSPWSQPAKSGHHAGLTDNNVVKTEGRYTPDITAAATDEAKEWEGWGTALKPAAEDWWLMRKPLDGTVARNVLAHGTGALNIDGCRVAHTETFGDLPNRGGGRVFNEKTFAESGFDYKDGGPNREALEKLKSLGRFPANVILDGSDVVDAEFANNEARFFYCAKANKRDRDEGLDGMPEVAASGLPMRSSEGERGGVGMDGTETDRDTKYRNTHPTVKNVNLMRYLVRLVTPPNGVCLDPFMGSGSTGKACAYEGFGFIGIEMDAHFVEVAEKRILYALANAPSQDDAPREVTRQLIEEAPAAAKRKRGRPPKNPPQQIGLFIKDGE
jgi:DNA modification methylase